MARVVVISIEGEDDFWVADLDAKIIPRRFRFGHTKQESSSGATDIEKKRPVRIGEHRFYVDRFRRLPVIRSKRVDMLVYADARHD